MLELCKLHETQMQMLYAGQMRRDFPPSELKELGTILGLMRRGVYEPLGVYDGEMLAAYTLIYRPEAGRMLLLDYLAVEPTRRGCGTGGEVLNLLRAHYSGCASALMIECERPRSAPDRETASRRIRFYERAGAKLTSVRIALFDVEYSILVLPCDDAWDEAGDWAEQILSLYRQMLPPHLFERHVRLLRA